MVYLTFEEDGHMPGRYRRRFYKVRILGCDTVGSIRWSPTYGWIFYDVRIHCNVEVMFKVSAFIRRLPVYRSGKAIKQSEKGYDQWATT